MKKINFMLIMIAATIFFAACSDAETKADRSGSKQKKETDSAGNFIPGRSDENILDNTTEKAMPPAGDTGQIKNDEPNEVLANIDKYLVTKASYPPPGANGGIVNGTVTVHNTLTDASFDRAMVEVRILLDDGKEYRTDFYTVINVEPGGTKTVKIPNTIRGNSVSTNVVKVKSNKLTNGEMIMVGSRYVPK